MLVEPPKKSKLKAAEGLSAEERQKFNELESYELESSEVDLVHHNDAQQEAANENNVEEIPALQRAPGPDHNDNKMETYQYNRLVKGLPHQ